MFVANVLGVQCDSACLLALNVLVSASSVMSRSRGERLLDANGGENTCLCIS